MIKEVEKIIMENGPRWETLFFPPRGLFFIKTSGSKKNPGGQPVVFLVFDPRSSGPRWVVKVSRNPSVIGLMEKEYENLLYVYHALSAPFRKTVPRPLLSREEKKGFLFIEGGVPGGPLPAEIQSSGAASYKGQIGTIFDRVSGWLLRFQEETREGEVEINDIWIAEEVQASIERYRSGYSLQPEEDEFLLKYLQKWQEWSQTRLPLVATHGDFWMGNLFFDREELSVFDWTFSRRKALPFDDLFLFLSSFEIDPPRGGGTNHLDSFEKIFFNRTWIREKVQETLVHFFFQHRLSPRLLDQLFSLFLIRMATREEGDYRAHTRRNPIWRERLLFYIRNKGRFIEI